MWRTTLVDPQPEGKHRFVLHQPPLLIFKSELNVNMRKKIWKSLTVTRELFTTISTFSSCPNHKVSSPRRGWYFQVHDFVGLIFCGTLIIIQLNPNQPPTSGSGTVQSSSSQTSAQHQNRKKIAAKKLILARASSDSPLLSVTLIAVYLLLLFFSIRFSSCRHHSRGKFLTAVMLKFVR